MPGAQAANATMVPWAYGRVDGDGTSHDMNSGHYRTLLSSTGVYLLTPTNKEDILSHKQGIITLTVSNLNGGSGFSIAVKEQDWNDTTGVITVNTFETPNGALDNASFAFIVFRTTILPPAGAPG